MRRAGAYMFESRSSRMMDLGDLFLIPAATPLQLRFEPGVRETLSCSFDPRKLAELGEFDWTDDMLTSTLNVRSPGARSTLLRLVSELQSPGPATRLVTEATVMLAVVELYRQVAGQPRLDERISGPLAPWQIRKIRERIEEALASNITLADLAADCRISSRHLMRGFKAATGMTVGDYITETRIHRATALLTGSTIPIKQVAHQCGFQSTAAFGTAYKRITGMTPGYHRKSIAVPDE